MNAAVKILSGTALAYAIDVLEIRAAATAYLEYEHQFEHLADAVDPLQEYAERSELVAAIGQDAVQQIIAAPFARFPRDRSRRDRGRGTQVARARAR